MLQKKGTMSSSGFGSDKSGFNLKHNQTLSSFGKTESKNHSSRPLNQSYDDEEDSERNKYNYNNK